MNKFLKPSLGKIIITIILLFLISYFSPCNFYSSGPYKILHGNSWSLCEDSALLVLVPGVVVFDASWNMWGIFGIGSWFALPVLLIISYLLSASIFYIIKKFKKHG